MNYPGILEVARKNKHDIVVLTAALGVLGSYALFGSPFPDEGNYGKTSGNPDINRNAPATVLAADVVPGGGSRLVLKQCISGQGCEEEIYKSKFSYAGQVYEKKDQMLLNDIIPPAKFIRDK